PRRRDTILARPQIAEGPGSRGAVAHRLAGGQGAATVADALDADGVGDHEAVGLVGELDDQGVAPEPDGAAQGLPDGARVAEVGGRQLLVDQHRGGKPAVDEVKPGVGSTVSSGGPGGGHLVQPGFQVLEGPGGDVGALARPQVENAVLEALAGLG